MTINGISHIYLDQKNIKFDLKNIKPVEGKVKYIPKSHKKKVYVYKGGFEKFSNNSISENIKNLTTMLRNIEVKKPEWKYITGISVGTGESFQLKYSSSSNVGNIIDTQV